MGANLRIRNSGVPNYIGQRILVKSGFNLQLLDHLLKDYHDRQLVQLLMYGFPIDHDGSEVTQSVKNHGGAGPQFFNHIKEYLDTEIKAGATVGPFNKPLFEGSAISPMNSVPKKDSEKRRIVIDLSFPRGSSVNDGIRADKYLDDFEPLRFPTVDNLIKLIHKKGPACLLFKRDLSRFFRQLPVDPGDVHLLGYTFLENFYFDVFMPMGLRSACRCAQRVSNAVTYIFSLQGFEAVNYIDDFGGAEEPDLAWRAFFELGNILQNIGLQEAKEKAAPPAPVMTFLGLEVNTLNMTIKIPADKMHKIRQELRTWAVGVIKNKKEVQSLCGLLNFAAACIRPGRVYFSRILNFLRSFKDKNRLPVSEDVFRDVEWWRHLAEKFNGLAFILNENWEKPDVVFSSDACLQGCGALTNKYYFSSPFPAAVKNICTDINQLECWTVFLALKLWSHEFARKRILIYCDNENSVRAINTGSSRDEMIQALLRNIHWLASEYSFELKCIHIKGVCNRRADWLSRFSLSKQAEYNFNEWNKKEGLKRLRHC